MALQRRRSPRRFLVLGSLCAAIVAATSGAASPPTRNGGRLAGTPTLGDLPVVVVRPTAVDDARTGSAASPTPRINVQPEDEGVAVVEATDPLDGAVAEVEAPRSVAGDGVGSALAPDDGEVRYAIELGTGDDGDPALAFDGDTETGWTGDEARATASFDLGTVRPVETVRWLPTGGGPIVLQRSLLGGVWVTVERIDDPEPDVWRTVPVEWPARYLRFRAVAGGNEPAGVTEVEVYGPAGAEVSGRQRSRGRADAAVDRTAERERRRDDRVVAAQEEREGDAAERAGRTDRAARREAAPSRAVEPAVEREAAGGGKDRAVDGRESVVESCGDGSGECRIEIDVSGGSATCDERGGSGNRAVGGNASAGEGGSCVRDASGGSIELDDINP